MSDGTAAIEWRPVNGFEGLYEVTADGMVRGISRRVRVGQGWTTVAPHMMQRYIGTTGYWFVQLRRGGQKMKRVAVHRLVAYAFVEGRTDECCEVSHLNHDKLDARAENLKWTTHLENVRQSSSIGRLNKKLKLGDKDRIRELRRLGHRNHSIAAAFGISLGYLSYICVGIERPA